MSHLLEDFRLFLNASPTAWHAVKEMENRLSVCDFISLNPEDKWELELGKRYFVAQGGTLCTFCLPKHIPRQALLFAAHTDSPALKIKPNPTYRVANMLQCGIEVYGGPLLSSWLNRDLILAGRVVITHGTGAPEVRLVILDDTLLTIPQLAIHLDRQINDKGLILNKQEHLCPLLGLTDNAQNTLEPIEQLLRRYISFHSLLSFELFLVPIEEARFSGMANEMLSSYRLDNLTSVHAALSAIGKQRQPSSHTLQMGIFWDHEEIGSHTQEGAASPFLQDIFLRIGHCLKQDTEELLLLKQHALCLSLDMAHAFNPNYPNKHDPQHQSLLGKGIVIKHNANHKYASNALSSSVIIHACQNLNLPYQLYASRADLSSGSTVGPFVATQLRINTVDIGCPQLSMHSIREVIACQDYLQMVQLLTYLLEANE